MSEELEEFLGKFYLFARFYHMVSGKPVKLEQQGDLIEELRELWCEALDGEEHAAIGVAAAQRGAADALEWLNTVHIEVYYSDEAGECCSVFECTKVGCIGVGDSGHHFLSLCDGHAKDVEEGINRARFARRASVFEGGPYQPKPSG